MSTRFVTYKRPHSVQRSTKFHERTANASTYPVSPMQLQREIADARGLFDKWVGDNVQAALDLKNKVLGCPSPFPTRLSSADLPRCRPLIPPRTTRHVLIALPATRPSQHQTTIREARATISALQERQQRLEVDIQQLQLRLASEQSAEASLREDLARKRAEENEIPVRLQELEKLIAHEEHRYVHRGNTGVGYPWPRGRLGSWTGPSFAFRRSRGSDIGVLYNNVLFYNKQMYKSITYYIFDKTFWGCRAEQEANQVRLADAQIRRDVDGAHRRLSMLSEALGLSIEQNIAQNTLKFTFTRVDPTAPERAFSFVIKLTDRFVREDRRRDRTSQYSYNTNIS